MFKAYRFRLEPTETQRETLAQISGCCRYTYNRFLYLQKERYQFRKTTGDTSIKFLSYNEMSAILPALKQEDDKLWLNNAAHMNLQQSLIDLTKAMKGWLTGKSRSCRLTCSRVETTRIACQVSSVRSQQQESP